ncbi:MAG TPA: hypothetical protein VME43_34330 [Bryobacteraceae bacterium]|nr:hypothetical protein [Bryobacteraceae bacterium]
MRHFGGFGLALFCAAGLFGQAGFGGRSPVVSSGFGHVFSPARRSISGLPGGGHSRATAVAPLYAYPVYVGGYGYLPSYLDSYGDDAYPPDGYGPDGGPVPPPQAPPQSNVTVVYPPQQTTVIINQSPDGGTPSVSVLQGPPPGYAPPPGMRRPPATAAPSNSSADDNETPHYLIAFKDHTIYSAVAYWVDGDTLHYFTTPSTHNQVSLALVDRDLTQRLNQESGIDLKLPPPPSAAK